MQELMFMTVIVFSVGSLVYSEQKFELSKPGGDIELKCPLEPPVQWMKDDDFVKPGDHYSLNAENGTLTIIKLISGDLVGKYSCNNSASRKEEIVVYAASVAKKFADRSMSLVEGENLELTCVGWGYPVPTIKWKRVSMDKVESELSSSDRITLADHDGLQNASLTITNLRLDDYASYTCVADNGYVYANSTYNDATILIRVKGKLTPLWPFIGIVIELIILFAIIIIYEKRKSNQAAEGDIVKNSEPAPAVANSNDHKDDENLRSRK